MFGQVIRASMAKDNGRRPALAKRPTKSVSTHTFDCRNYKRLFVMCFQTHESHKSHNYSPY